MKKFIVSLFLAVSMILSMLVPTFAADEYAPIESEFHLQLLPVGTASGSVIKVEEGDVVPVNLYLSCMEGNTELDEFGFYEFYDTITFRDSRFALVEGSIETAAGFDCEIVNDGKIRVTADVLTELEAGVVLYFELEAKMTGYAYLCQDAYISGLYGECETLFEYDLYCDTLDIQAVPSLDEDGAYFVGTNYDPDCGSVVLPEDYVSAGDQVIFYVLKEPGFEVTDISVRYKLNGVNRLALCKSATNSTGARFYYFTMPEANVTINVEFEGDSITDTTPTIKISSTTACAGDIIKLHISLENNPGIAAMRLKVGYRSDMFTLLSVEDAGVLGNAMHSDNLYASPYTLCWANGITDKNFDANGIIATLSFRISEDAADGDYKFTIDFAENDILDINIDSVKFISSGGTVEITHRTPGDASGDGKTDMVDVMYLARYIANWDGFDKEKVKISAMDLNLDNKVNSLDLIILSRHLANWTGYETLPYTPQSENIKSPWDYTYEEFMEMTGDEQMSHLSKFNSMADFYEWYNAAKAKYEEEIATNDN